jgi:3-deoxy-D-manno-octulosonic-acid transferase
MHSTRYIRFLYQLVLWLTLPIWPLRLLLRSLKEPGYRRHLSERWGGGPPGLPGAVWIHAVSVGEVRAARSLIVALQARQQPPRLLLTCTTPAGRATAAELFGEQVTVRYLPYDYPWALRRFLDRARPRLCLIMETEWWPNLLEACRRRQLPVCLLNARLSARSARGYARFAGLSADMLANFRVIAAQSKADAERLRALGGVNIQVTGNLKFDAMPPVEQRARGADWRRAWGPAGVILVASTRPGEEALLLDAWQACRSPGSRLLIVPRHPHRFDEVATLIASRGWRLARRSQMSMTEPFDVCLGDSLGEMYAYCAACDVAIIGGSLLDFGGQNPIEAMVCGRPVIVGPYTRNFRELVASGKACGAILEVESAAGALTAATRLLIDAPARQAMGRAGESLVAQNQGATRRTMDLLAHVLGPEG